MGKAYCNLLIIYIFFLFYIIQYKVMSFEMVLPHPIFVPIALGLFLNFLSVADPTGQLLTIFVSSMVVAFGITWMRVLN